ncbi:MAG TPA: isoprenylcysteine carboxylmethyltransferase family protein [Vicinamibacterales bacterium]|nr:isoprenylcysteine carboxylmethyltransferase family protein [Vicinamibacterales bacterium]
MTSGRGAAPADNAGVPVPPPLVYVAAIAAGAVLNRFVPLTIGGGLPRVVLAWALVAVWALITGASFYAFWSRHTSVVPIRPAATLVAAAPYRFTRNPMYLGLACLTLGVGLWIDTWWVIVLLVPALAVIDRVVIAREEAYLRRRFGADYESYTRRVRRWL